MTGLAENGESCEVETRWGKLTCPLRGFRKAPSCRSAFNRERGAVGYAAVRDGRCPARHLVAASFAVTRSSTRSILGNRVVRVKGQPYTIYNEGHAVFVRIPGERCYVLEPLRAETPA